MWKKYKHDIRSIVMVSFGAFLSACAINMFVHNANLVPSGFSGLSLLISRVLNQFLGINIPFSYIYYLLNLPATILVYKYVGKKFTRYSILNIVLFGIFTQLIPNIKITDDIILLCIFGGTINAFGSLLALEGNASAGGTDFIAIYAANKYQKSTWNYVLIFNAVVILISGLIFDVDAALYSIVYQFTSTMLINMYHSRYKVVTLNIVTEYPEAVSEAILAVTRHGITRLDGMGVYKHENRSLLYLVCGEFEVKAIVHAIKKADSKSFINEYKSRRVIGNYYLKPLE